jgi:hypothetical protein
MDEDSTLRSKEKRKEAAIHRPALRRLLHCGSSWVRVVAVHPPLCHDLSNVKVQIVTSPSGIRPLDLVKHGSGRRVKRRNSR